MAGSISYLDDLPRTAEMVVVGGGVVGAATAFHAARAGIEPLLIERRPALATVTTAASTGAFRLQFDNEEEWWLVAESVELFLRFAEVTRQDKFDLALRQQGYLWVTTEEERAVRQRQLVEMQRSWGQGDVELISGGDLRRRWPYLTRDAIQGRFRAGDGFLDPKALTLGLVAGAGVAVAANCEVVGFDIEDGCLKGVVTNRGTVAAEVAVIAAGPFSLSVAATAGVSLPVTTVARHKVVTPEVPEVPREAPMTIDDDTGAHWRPALAGAFLLYTDPETPPSPAVEDVAPDHSLAFRLLDPGSPVSVARIAPFWGEVWRRGAHWSMQSGHYTMTPDHRPLLGPTDIEGLYVNTGYSGHGIMASPAGSRHLLDVITGKIADADNPFRLDRVFEARDLDLL